MEYKIKISGGFVGVSQNFEGKLLLSESKEQTLKKLLDQDFPVESNKNLRDTFLYDLNLKVDGKSYSNSFNDANIPIEIIELIDEIKKKEN
jgi:hypothetical protein